jgi:dolichyl-phosphate beta-glucosyltransferase
VYIVEQNLYHFLLGVIIPRMTRNFISIIIPAHNEEARLPRALEQLNAFLSKQSYTSEVVVVENGSHDRTYQVGQEFASHIPNLRIIHLDESGKGLAVRNGIFATTGEFRFIADADFSMPVEEINFFVPPACNSDIAIASREAPGSVRYNEPPFRHFIGRIYNLLIRLLLLPGLSDTQCGFKCFRSEVAEDIFHYQTLNGWSFDAEVLRVARLHGWKIAEIPIHCYYFPSSKIKVLRDSPSMLFDLMTIRRNIARGDYNRENEPNC